MTNHRSGAAAAWAEALEEWAIPPEILAAAPAEPWEFSPQLFAWTPERAAEDAGAGSASRRWELEALPDGGSVLDVGVGGGRASLPLSPPAGLITGVDSSPQLLAVFAEAAERHGVPHREVEGRWPEVAPKVEPADLVVSHHVLYNVADVVPFIASLTDHARRKVVLEISGTHPVSNLNEAWKALHGIDRPTRPTAADALAVLEEMGLEFEYQEEERPMPVSGMSRADRIASARRRLCVGPERDAEIDAVLGPDFERLVRRVMAVRWDGTAG